MNTGGGPAKVARRTAARRLPRKGYGWSVISTCRVAKRPSEAYFGIITKGVRAMLSSVYRELRGLRRFGLCSKVSIVPDITFQTRIVPTSVRYIRSLSTDVTNAHPARDSVRDIHKASAQELSEGKDTFSFSASGWLIPFHFGAMRALKVRLREQAGANNSYISRLWVEVDLRAQEVK